MTRAREEQPPRADPFFDRRTEKLISGARSFQDNEAELYKSLVPLINDVHDQLVAIYAKLPVDAEEGDYKEPVLLVVGDFIVKYNAWLLEKQVEAGAAAARDSETALALQGYASRFADVAEAHTYGDAVGSMPVPGTTGRVLIDFDFHQVPQHVRRWANDRDSQLRSGYPTGYLSRQIWARPLDQVYDLIRSNLRGGSSSQQFAATLAGFGEPGPTHPPSRMKSNQHGLPYNAFRLARTEIMYAYNQGRKVVDDDLMRQGIIAGTRWILSRTHRERVGFDVCDVWADHVEPDLGWLADYGVASRGVYLPNSIPVDHPNGLCVTSPVATPQELYRQALTGAGPVPTVVDPRQPPPPPPEGYKVAPLPPKWTGDGETDARLTMEWLNDFATMQGWSTTWNGLSPQIVPKAGYWGAVDWFGQVKFDFDHWEDKIKPFFAQGRKPEHLSGLSTLFHEMVHTMSVKRDPVGYEYRNQKILEEGATTWYAAHLLGRTYKYLFGEDMPISSMRYRGGNYPENYELMWKLGQTALRGEGIGHRDAEIADAIDKWKKLVPTNHAWPVMIEDMAAGIGDRLGRKLKRFEINRLGFILAQTMNDSTQGHQGVLTFEERVRVENHLDNLIFEFERYPEWWKDPKYTHPNSPAGFTYQPVTNPVP